MDETAILHPLPARASDEDTTLPVTERHRALLAEGRILQQIGFGKPVIAEMMRRAERGGTTIEEELLSDGWVDAEAYYAALARLLGLRFHDRIDAREVSDSQTLDSQLVRPVAVRCQYGTSPPLMAVVPEAAQAPRLIEAMDRLPALRAALCVASPATIRRAVWQAGAARRVQGAVNDLFDRTPRFSARIVFSGNQGFYAGFCLATLAACLIVAPQPTVLFVHVVLSLLYLSSLLLRIGALTRAGRHDQKRRPTPVSRNEDVPVYTILVALYQEAEVVPQLIAALSRINWPRARLDIKLVCEEDDLETLAAIRALDPGPQFEIVEVPPIGPRTKPKALTYALPGARGTYLAVYDAEDRPHPDQLREAHETFARLPEDVACLQAPLVITNARQSWISALFLLEYSALFRALLPMLARHRMPLPLGGTSNHFRTDILRAAGGWDPHNVTEDADIGMRLYRLGYHSDVILRQTLEDAPTEARIWRAQRTRWFKGWLQTWLVMMRDPMRLHTEIGLRAFSVFHLMIGGMLVSSLAHPVILVFLGFTLAAMLETPAEAIPPLSMVLIVVDLINIFGSYAIFLALGALAMIRHEKRQVGWRATAVPIYWLMISWAAWRAVYDLRRRPFFWNKTPHRATHPDTK